MDYRCAVAFGAPPYTMEKTTFDLWIKSIPAARRNRYIASRGIQFGKVVVEGITVHFAYSTLVGVWPEVWAAFQDGIIAQDMPLCERLNGYGVRITYSASA